MGVNERAQKWMERRSGPLQKWAKSPNLESREILKWWDIWCVGSVRIGIFM